MEVLLLSILAHIISDFIFQSDYLIKLKSKGRIKGFLSHGIITFVTLIVLLHMYNFKAIVVYGLLITIIHVLVDYGKYCFGSRKNSHKEFIYFVFDQVIHLITIFALWEIFNISLNKNIIFIYKNNIFPKIIAVLNQSNIKCNPISINDLLIYIIVYLFVIYGGAVITRKYLNIHFSNGPLRESDIKASKNVGKYIGIFERIIVLTCVITSNFSSIAFILTAKSIARYSELNNKDFAEYYLLGTLLSVVIAVIGGFLLMYLVTIF